jgi:hypothetical protein
MSDKAKIKSINNILALVAFSEYCSKMNQKKSKKK